MENELEMMRKAGVQLPTINENWINFESTSQTQIAITGEARVKCVFAHCFMVSNKIFCQ